MPVTSNAICDACRLLQVPPRMRYVQKVWQWVTDDCLMKVSDLCGGSCCDHASNSAFGSALSTAEAGGRFVPGSPDCLSRRIAPSVTGGLPRLEVSPCNRHSWESNPNAASPGTIRTFSIVLNAHMQQPSYKINDIRRRK